MKNALLISICLSSTLVQAQTTSIQYGEVIPITVSGESYLLPRIEINGDDMPVILYGSHTPHGSYVKVGGTTGFSPAMPLHVPGFSPAVGDWFGGSLAVSGNTVWAVMKGMPETTSPIYVRRSDDGGMTWGDTDPCRAEQRSHQ